MPNIQCRTKDIHLKEYWSKHGEQEYRYMLSRFWDEANKIVTVIMCNPSDASYLYEDKTVMNINNFFIKHGEYNRINVLNLFAYRNKNKFKSQLNKINKDYEAPNNLYIENSIDEAELIVVAWGYGKEKWENEYMKGRIKEVNEILKNSCKVVKCFTNKNGDLNLHPRNLNLDEWDLADYILK